jgi:hypothetical protein
MRNTVVHHRLGQWRARDTIITTDILWFAAGTVTGKGLNRKAQLALKPKL